MSRECNSFKTLNNHYDIKHMEREELRAKIYSKIDELPTLPAVLPKLLSRMEDEKSSATHIAEIISNDPALTSKVLKVSNSAYYGFSQEIAGVDRAVPLLGFNMVRSLALSIGVIDTLASDKNNSHFSQEGLWVHGLAVATAMEKLGKKSGKKKNNEHYFVVGLLHDVGKIVLSQFFNELFQQALKKAHSSSKEQLYLCEHEIIGFDHGEVGGMLLTRWKFPKVISTSISLHHQQNLPENVNPVDIAMLRIADALPQELGLGDGGNPITPVISKADLKTIGMNEKDLEDVRVHLNNAKDGIEALLGAIA